MRIIVSILLLSVCYSYENCFHHFGGEYNDFGYAVVQTYDGGYAVVGTQYSSGTQYDLLLVTFNSSLVEQSSMVMDLAILTNDALPNYASDMQQTPDGGYVSVGSSFNGTDYDAWVIKFNPSLATVWTTSIGTAGSDDFGNSIEIMSSGNYIVCGTSYDAINSDHDIAVWGLTSTGTATSLYAETDNGLHDYGNYAEQTSDGGIIIIGTQGNDILLIKLISDGDGTYSADTGFSTDGFLTTGTANNDEGVYVRQSNDGSYIIIGNTQTGTGQQSDVYINTITSAGGEGTAVTMGGAYDDEATYVRQTADGGFIFTGSKYGQSTMKDIWVVKLTAALTVHWDYTYGGDSNDHGQFIAQTYDGRYVVTGSTWSYGNQSQIILLKLDANGLMDGIEYDCAGECGGTAKIDNCGNCDADSSNDCVQDCNGIWGGIHTPTFICQNGEITCNYNACSNTDCAGVVGGTATVDECGVCGGDGSSCDGTLLVPTEYSTIQSAIDASSTGDTVLVASGTYTENIDYGGKNIVVISSHGAKQTTIIPYNTGITIVWFANDETRTAKLIGFTLLNGGDLRGGAINIEDASPTIENCILIDSKSHAVKSWASSPKFINCLFTGIDGRPIYFSSANYAYPEVINCTFVNNNEYGLFNSQNYIPDIKNCIIYNNADGGAFGQFEINYSNIEGGWYYGVGNIDTDPLFCDPTIGDYSIAQNSPCVGNGENGVNMGALGVGCTEPAVYGCITSTACNYNQNANTDDGSCANAEENYDCDGDCVNDTDVDGICDELEVSGCTVESACNYNADATDDDDSCTYAEENYDCEGNCTAELDECGVCGGLGIPEGDCDGGGLSLFGGLIPEEYNLHSIYPNPFNPIANIIYGLPEHVNVRILVYDLSGKQVETLINEFQTPGYHSVNWNADNLPSGVYLIRMDSGDFTQTQKVVLIN